MFSTFFRFETRFWLRSMMLYVFVFVLGVFMFAAATSDNVVVGSSLDNTHRNAPYVIQMFFGIMAILTTVMTAAFVNSAASRDFIYDTHEMIFTKPIKKLPFLMGRFWGAALISVIPMLGITIGVILAGFMPWIEPEQWGPIAWRAHLASIVTFAIPNAIFVAAIIFAIAVWTRSSMASFIGAILLIVGYSISQNMVGNLDNERLSAMTDPFGLQAFSTITKYWTVSDKNTQFVGLTGVWRVLDGHAEYVQTVPLLVANRVLWLAIGMAILAAACARFSFAERHRRTKRVLSVTPALTTPPAIPQVDFHHGFRSQLSRLASQIKVDFFGTIKSSIFIVVMLTALLNTVVGLIFMASEGFGLRALPVTYNVINIIQGSMYAFLLAVITFFAGVMVWKERDAKLDEVYDALPQPTWIAYLAKLISLTLIVVLILLVGVAAGISVQAAKGYTRFQFDLYLTELFTIDLVQMFCLIVLAFISHVVSPNKYFGYFLFIVLVIVNTFLWMLLKIETNMVDYGSLPGHVYSDMFRYAPFARSLNWFSLYWLLFTGLVSVAAILLWQRGKETAYMTRVAIGKSRWTGGLRWASLLFLAAFALVASWVYYNTQLLNTYDTQKEQTTLLADYEKKFKQFEDTPQPRITKVSYKIDVYPERRALHLVGDQVIKNKSDESIDRIFINMPDDYETELTIENGSLEEEIEDYGWRVYALDPPMAPGETLNMSYEMKYEPAGFENRISVRQIVQNGTFFNNTIVPQIGYQPNAELSDKKDRKKHDLGPPAVMPPLEPDNLAARGNTYLSNSSDWVDVETVISTSADQIAIAPGSLQKAWEENGRRYFHYKLDHPSLNFYSFISARYKVAAQKWRDIDIEVYYHPDHEWNVDNMLRSIRKSLEYYTEHFGPYKHKQARIIEFPRVASFAQAFPGTMPYSEAIGFIADIEKQDDIDMVYYVVAHEMAHQWWAHQVIGANMQGATMLSETLAQYSALMVMEKEYGRDMMRKFLKYEMDQYLSARGREMLDERPLAKVESNQGYIYYRKGSVVMYYLKEMIGEEKINTALRGLIDKFGYKGPPYPTSQDLVDALREQTPAEYQYLLDDLFDHITLFANRTKKATYTERTDGKFDVTIEVECKKFQADEQGEETEIPVNDWIEIGAFEEPEKGKRYGATLHRERKKITQTDNTFTFTVARKPLEVGIDPFALLIDRMPDDNMKKPKRVTETTE
jgi:ABC-2 type transport system permease protein